MLRFLIIFLLLGVPVIAQEGHTIMDGDSITGNLTSGQSDFWTFEVQAGDVVNIVMRSNEFDPYLRLVDSDGQEIAFNDDSYYELSATIGLLRIPATGAYTIEARGFDRQSGGAYELSFEITDNVLSYKDYSDIRAMLSPAGDRWTFEGQAGESVAVNLYGTVSMQLFAPDHASIPVTSNQTVVVLPQTGTYTLMVINSSGVMSRTYELQLRPADAVVNNMLVYGDRVEGEIRNAEDEQRWQFEGKAGETITITMSSGDFEPEIELLSPAGLRIGGASQITGEQEENEVQIGHFPLTESGIYTLVTSRAGFFFADDKGGTYTLYIGRADVASRQPLEYGQREPAIIAGNIPDRWTFEGDAGDTVVITATSIQPRVNLELLDIYNRSLATSRDLGDGISQINPLVLPKTGLYSVIVNSVNIQGGKYLIVVNETTMPALAMIHYDDAVETTLAEATRWQFQASAGDIVTIQLASDDFDAFVTLLDTDQVVLAENDDADGLNAQIGPILLTESGNYTVVIQAANPDASGLYRLSLLIKD